MSGGLLSMVDLIVSLPLGLANERRYACDVVLRDWLGLDYSVEASHGPEVRITAAGDLNGRALRLPDVFFRQAAKAWLRPESLPAAPSAVWDAGVGGILPSPVPILFGEEPSRRAEQGPDGAQDWLPIDIFGSIFFLLSRYEEVVCELRDDHDRFPVTASFCHRCQLLDRPLANEYLEILWAHLKRLWPELRRRIRTYSVDLSHDIDVPFAVPGRRWTRIGLNICADIVRRRAPAVAVRRLRSKLLGAKGIQHHPNNTFSFIMAASERNGLQSTFFFKPGVSDSRFDSPYSVDAPPVASLLSEIHARGHQLGLHPSYHTYRDRERLQTEFAILLEAAERLGIRQEAWGGRQHFLRFAVPMTWRNYASVGLAYDATLTYADEPGFRCGTCYGFPVYDLEQRRSLPLRERPLIAMESSLLDRSEVRWGSRRHLDAARERITRLADVCRRFAGSFSLLWHNTSLITPAQQRVYQDILSEVVR
jgi:hypothetical protein